MYVGLLVATGLAGFVALVMPDSFAGEQVRRRIRGWSGSRRRSPRSRPCCWCRCRRRTPRARSCSTRSAASTPAWSPTSWSRSPCCWRASAVVVATTTDTHPGPRRRGAMLAGAVVAAVSPALVGHTRSYQPTALLLGADAVHLLAGATWLGGLVGLVLTVRALAGRELLAASTLARFSTLASSLLFAVALAGAVLAWRILGAWSGFVDTRYGRAAAGQDRARPRDRRRRRLEPLRAAAPGPGRRRASTSGPGPPAASPGPWRSRPR